MDRYPYAKPPCWWSPRWRRMWISFWRPIRLWQQRRDQRVVRIDVQGLEHVQRAMQSGLGVLVTPNHSSHADCYLLLDALLRLGRPSYIMTAWQVFHLMPRWERMAYRHHGCFSVDREGKDLRAFRQGVKILAETSEPLVVFPEGEVYHLNDRVMPFRDGTLMIAATAVKRSRRAVACVPCALKYFYVNDPTPELRSVALQIEQRLGIAVADDMPLAERVERLQAETLAWRERQYAGSVGVDPLARRRDNLVNGILSRLEQQFELNGPPRSVPERVKQLRQHLIESLALTVDAAPSSDVAKRALEDIFVAVQLFSYDFGYVSESVTLERIAETIDKLEEDVLGERTARIRGTRRGVVRFAAPICMDQALDRQGVREFSAQLRQRLQDLLDGFHASDKAPA